MAELMYTDAISHCPIRREIADWSLSTVGQLQICLLKNTEFIPLLSKSFLVKYKKLVIILKGQATLREFLYKTICRGSSTDVASAILQKVDL